jgi:hypothetical protein
MRYLKATVSFGIMYKSKAEANLTMQGWTDSDYVGDYDDRKSTSGYVFTMGSSAVSWSSKKQPIVTLSTTEAEFVSAASSACQCIWMRSVLNHLHLTQSVSTTSIMITVHPLSSQRIQ